MRLVAVAAAAATATAGFNVAVTPPMGYNTWNYFGCGVNETILQNAALVMNQSGLQAAGYHFIKCV